VKEFVTAVKPNAGKIDKTSVITMKHDGTEIRFYEPDAGSLGIMMMVAQQNMTAQNMGTFIEFIFNCMDEETQLYFRRRLMDIDDPFGFDGEGGMMEIFKALTEEWSARPTKQPSDFRPARRATGQGSTAPTRAKAPTSSRSRSAGSSR
jgi:hypothetical protein